MPTPATDRYRFADFTVDASRARLVREGVEIPLRPKSFDVLLHLVRNHDRLVTKNELLAAVWPSVVVTDDSLTRCISEVRSALGDAAQQAIRTVPTRGYIFEGAVTQADEPVAGSTGGPPLGAPAPVPATPAAPTASPPAAVTARGNRTRRLALAGLLLVAASVAVFGWLSGRQPVPPRLSLVVLPFVNLSGEPGQEYFADVLTDDLSTALSRLRGATVIAPGSAFTFKDSRVDPKQLGAALNVRYVLAGSVLRGDATTRINARLVDTQSGANLWADQFDAPRADLLRTQDEIVARLASALDAELTRAETRRSLRAGAPVDADDLAMQCEAASFVQGGEAQIPAYALCEEALRIDPRNVRALVRLGTYYATRVSRVQSPDPQADLARADALVARAIDTDPDYYAAHCAKAMVLGGEHRLREAVAASNRCLELNPSDVGAYRTLAIHHFFLAQPEKTLEFADRGMILSPRDPQIGSFLQFKGWAYFMLGRDAEAIEWLRRAAAAAPDSPNALAALASQLALAGHVADARATMARYLSASRTRTRTVLQWNYMPDDNAAFRDFDARFKRGLLLAGMPP